MNPMLIIAIPLGLVILGMILNSFDLGFDHPRARRSKIRLNG